jgi:hypothetical protein
MKGKPGGKLTYANVMSTLGVFIALGGVYYAATNLPKSSVGTKQLKANAVNSGKVKDYSLGAQDFAPGQLPAGKEGTQGPQGALGAEGEQGLEGPQGPQGGWQRIEASTAVDSENEKDLEVTCPSGNRIFGGGTVLTGPGFTSVVIDASAPVSESTWFAGAHEHKATADSWALNVSVICANS